MRISRNTLYALIEPREHDKIDTGEFQETFLLVPEELIRTKDFGDWLDDPKKQVQLTNLLTGKRLVRAVARWRMLARISRAGLYLLVFERPGKELDAGQRATLEYLLGHEAKFGEDGRLHIKLNGDPPQIFPLPGRSRCVVSDACIPQKSGEADRKYITTIYAHSDPEFNAAVVQRIANYLTMAYGTLPAGQEIVVSISICRREP